MLFPASNIFNFIAFSLLSENAGRESIAQIHLYTGSYNFSHNKLMLGVYSHFVVIVVGYVASLFFPKPQINKNLLISGWKEERKNEEAIVLH